MKLFVGLGNPGAKYAHHRHNIGFMALDAIADHYRFAPWKKKFQGFAAEGEIGGEKVLLLKPQTYMNDSGLSVGDAARFHKIKLKDIAVFHDELDLAPSKIKVKIGGGDAGHNGLRSISQHLGSDYKRVRLGIGHPGVKELVTHHVLGDFAKADAAWLEALLKAIADASPRLAADDDARFLTDVARLLMPPKETKATTTADAADKVPKASSEKTKPATKATTALADKLRNLWKPGDA
jgi:peptidyl-tRNA hydrolase, PTH1 family